MGTAFSEEKKTEVSPTEPAVAAQDVTTEPVAASQNATTEEEVAQNVDATHPRNHETSKEAFARVAAASENEKSSILSAELAEAEKKAEINLAQFFEALESRCETDEEREALKVLVKHRKEEQERWKLAQSGKDLNSMPFPTGSYEAPQVPASSLEWWAGLPSASGARDVNEKVFPLRHFKAKGDGDSVEQEEVPTSAESLRQEMIASGEGGWVKDELADGEVVNNKNLSWVCTPAIQAMTDDEIKFLNGFWERRGLGEVSGQEKDFNTELEGSGAWQSTEELKDVIANDVTTPDQEAVIKLRQTRGALPDEVRQRRVRLLAKHFAEREQKKNQAHVNNPGSPSKKVEVPPTAFFEERLEVSTEETTKAQKDKRLADHEAAIDALAEEGSKYTSFGASSPTKANGSEETSKFPFTSPEAKAKVDAIIARREKERAIPPREAPLPPAVPSEVSDAVVPPPAAPAPDSESEPKPTTD